MKLRNPRLGYTLVEMVVVATIISFIGIVLFNIFSQGLHLWARANTVRPGINVRFFIEKLTDDLRNTVLYDSQSLMGTKNSMQVFVLEKTITQGAPQRTIEKVQYDFDVRRKALIKKTFSYPDLLINRKGNIRETVVLEKVKEWNISYYMIDPEKFTGSWRSSWAGECLPNAIKVSIDYDEIRPRKITHIIPMLAGTCG